MKRTAWGLLALSISFVLGTIIAAGSLISMRGRLDTAVLTSQPFNASTLLVTCLDPLAILLEIAAIVLIVLDSGQIGNPHRRLARIAAVLFAVWAAVNLGVFLPLSYLGIRRGSLALAQAGQVAKAAAALCQYAVPFLLAFGLRRGLPRALLWAALVLTVAGNLGVVALPIAGMQLERVDAAGQAMYVPRFAVDYTRGPYPVLLAMGYLGGVLYLAAYVLLAVSVFRRTRGEASKELT